MRDAEGEFMRVELITQSETYLIYHKDSKHAEPFQSFCTWPLPAIRNLPTLKWRGRTQKHPKASYSPHWVYGFSFVAR